MRELFAHLIAPYARRIKQMITRGIVKLVDSDTLFQELQVIALNGEVLDGIELFEQYGITSHPHADAETIVLSLGGRRAHTIALVAGNRQYRLKGLAEGEVALYDDQGQKVHITRGGIVVTTDKGLTINADVTINGAVSATGDVSDGTGSMQGMRDTYNGHGHPALNTPPSQTM